MATVRDKIRGQARMGILRTRWMAEGEGEHEAEKTKMKVGDKGGGGRG